MRIEARNISVRIGRAELLHAVDLDAAPGEVLGLIGPNGAGKSTLLRVLAQLRQPDTGTLRIDGQSAGETGARKLSQRLAYLAQGRTLAWPLTVENLVALGRVPHQGGRGTRDDHGAAAIEQAIAAADLSAFRHRIADTLSGGELARCLLARALAVGGDALLADEPVASLDPYHQLQVMEILRARATAGSTVIVVLHELALAARFCDRLLLLDGGRVAACGRPDEVLNDANLAQVYRVQAERVPASGAAGAAVLPWRRIDARPPLEKSAL